MSNKRGDARTFGQDLMRGEHTVGEKKPAATAVSQRLAPGGGGGGAWLGGPVTESSAKFGHGLKSNTASSDKAMEYAGGFEGHATGASGTSIFDPVLTELMYRWFCPPGGAILDPFAGGSVRGIVAAKLGYQYLGIELRPEQLAANEAQAVTICPKDAHPPAWALGDALTVGELAPGRQFDFLFSCPPYHDLEMYSDDPRDLSNMTWDQFRTAYRQIIANCVALLRPNRFAFFVVGDVRDKSGMYRTFPEETVAAFEAAGARKYNEAILVTAIGSLPVRIGKQFEAGRKLGKTHQNVLGFVKGDPKAAAAACKGVDQA